MTGSEGKTETRKSLLPKKFYSKAAVAEVDGGYGVALDGRTVRTPARAVLAVAEKRIAEAMVAEWEAQGERIDPATMPVTSLANTAIDRVTPMADEVRAEIRKYAETDLLCYRAESPESLCARQTEAWDPVLVWAERRYDAPLVLAGGIMPVDQPHASIDSLARAFRDFTPLALAAAHIATSLTGSAILALALAEGERTPDEVWAAAHIDEDWQIELWGEDAEASARRAARRNDFDAAALVLGVAS